MPIDVATRLAKIYARATDATLAKALRTMAAQATTPDTARVRSWLIDELERRHPAADTAINEVFSAAVARQDQTGQYVHVDYVAVLLDVLGL